MSETQTTALAPIAADTSLQPATLAQLKEFADTFAVSDLLPKHLRGKPADVAITVMHGRELGLTPMQAISGIFVVEGRPSLSATTAVALVKRSPLCEYFQCSETTDKRATYETLRRGEKKPTVLTFTIEDAQRAGLTTKNTWKSYPAAMLRNRAALGLARDVYPDVIANILSDDEADDLRGPGMVAPPAPAATPTAVRPPANAIEATATPVASPATLINRIAIAASKDELACLAVECQAAPPSERDELRAAYAKRKKELDAPAPAPAAAPAPPVQESASWGAILEAGATTVEREPGADDDA